MFNRAPLISSIRIGVCPAMLVLAGCLHYTPQPITAPAALAAVESRALDNAELARFLRANRQVTEWPPRSWDLHSLTLVAFYYHPDLDVARSGWAAAKAGIVTAGERPNPGAGGGPGYNSTTPTSVITPWIWTLGFDFTVETAGKRGHRIAVARQLSEAARLHIATVAWQVRSRVRQSLLDLYAAGETAKFLERQQAIQQGNIALLERQLGAGAISPFEVTQARLVLDTIRLAMHDAARQQAEGRVQLAASLGVTVRALDAIALAVDPFGRAPSEIAAPDARRQALVNRPDILGALSEYGASEAALQLEIARQYPDIHLGPGYQLDQANNKWTLNLGGVLPLFNRNCGPIAEAEARRGEAAARFTSVQSRAIEEIDRAAAAYRAAIAKTATADALLADLQRQERSARAQFEAGEISRLELGSIQLELAASELSRLDALVKAHQSLGQLEDAMQSPADLGEWLSTTPPRQPPARKEPR